MRLKKGSWRGAAFLISIGVHVTLLAALFGGASGAILAAEGGTGDVSTMNVTLVTIAAPEVRRRQEAASRELMPLFAKFGSDAPPVHLPPDRSKPSNNLSQFLRRLEAAKPAPSGEGLAEQDPQSRSELQPRPAQPAEAGGRPGEGDANATATPGSAGALWGAIEPCWNKLPRTSTVPVSLEVTLNIRGDVSTPPKILRAGKGRLDERRLRAEANALAALEACMPRSDLRFGGRTYRLEFGPRR